MNVLDALFLLALAVLLGYWFDSLRALEIARAAGKRACRDADVQFLDDTVAGISISLARNESGRRVLRRAYRFEFSDTGDSRLEGRMTLLGSKVESLTMEPRRILY